jgi:hypothetical protein
MRTTLIRLLAVAVLASVLLPAASAVSAQSTLQPVEPLFWQPSMNIFRRFSIERAKMIEFYGKVLALRPLSTFELGGGGQMTRFGAGTSEIRLTAGQPRDRQYPAGALKDVTGLRVITFFFPSEADLTSRRGASRSTRRSASRCPASR